MYAIAFDLVVADTQNNHPKGVSQAYSDIAMMLADHGFRRIQGSLYVTDEDNMGTLFKAIQTLRSQTWFQKSVRDIRAFRIEQWSDFTDIVKS